MGWDGQGGVAHLLYAVAESGGICVRGEHMETGKKNLTAFSVRKTSRNELHAGAHCSQSLFFKRSVFLGSFACGCGRNRCRSCADAIEVILKILMWFSAYWWENNAEREEKEKMAASQVNVLSWVRGCLLFLLKCHGLRTCKPFIFYFWCSCLVRLFSTTFPPLPTIVKVSSLLLPCVPVFPQCLHPGSPQSTEHSHHEVVTFNSRNYSFCERATWEGITIQNSLWDNFRCWDTSEDGKVEWLLYI